MTKCCGRRPFNPDAIIRRYIGPFGCTLTGVSAATISYTAEGAGATKSPARWTLGKQSLAGSYIGGLVGRFPDEARPA